MAISSESEKERALIRKYLAGKCNPTEHKWVEAWYNSFEHEPLPGKTQELESIRRVKKTLIRTLAPQRKTFYLQSFLKIAALLALITTVSLLVHHYIYPNPDEVFSEVITRNGERKTVKLSDGSIVMLNAGSKLRVLPDFGDSTRQVILSGEAYFSVTKDRLRPFIVKTGTIRTQVLGTAFNIQAYDNEDLTTVAVAKGKVKVARDGKLKAGKELSPGIFPGKQLIYDKIKKDHTILNVDVAHISAWRTGILYFENESITSIARKLERKYNLKIKVTGNDKPGCRYTLHFSDESIYKALEVLSRVSGITYTFQHYNNHLLIHTEACR